MWDGNRLFAPDNGVKNVIDGHRAQVHSERKTRRGNIRFKVLLSGFQNTDSFVSIVALLRLCEELWYVVVAAVLETYHTFT